MTLPLPHPLVVSGDGTLDPHAVQTNLEALARATASSVTLAYPTVTSLPTTGTNGQIIYYVADATNGVVWAFKYRSASASAYKWEYVGGPPLYAENTTVDTTTSATYVALATAGPSVTLPLAGDFDVEIGMRAFNNTAGQHAFMSYDIGGTGAVDADAVDSAVATGNTDAFNVARRRRKTGLTAVALVSKYRVGAGTGSFGGRWMAVTPVRVG